MTWYTGDVAFDTVLTVALALIPLTVIGLLVMKAPYGRFAEEGGLALDPRIGWFLMELPATVVFWMTFLQMPRRLETVPMVLAGMWGFHYLNRGFVFPALMRVPKGRKGSFGWLVVASGWGVTSMHGYMNARWYGELGPHLVDGWFADPRFLIGVAVYAVGFAINVHADHVLRTLRTKDEVAAAKRVYRIPRGGLYRFVTNPSYLGELIAWAGFACFTWSLAGVFIFGISAANLVPRAFSTHKWYLGRFDDYPRERKALIPFLL
ncbi:MAG: methyltransferase [Sandaracinaceae bacterium]